MTGISFMYSKSSCPMYNNCYQPNNFFNKLEPTSTLTLVQVTARNKVHLMPPTLSNHHLHTISPPLSSTHLFKHRLYSSSTTKAFETSSSSGFDGSDHLQKVKEILDIHKYLPHVIVSIGLSLAKFIGVWVFWPWMLRKLHGYLIKKYPRLALGGKFENSFWGALEVSFRSYVTFMEVLNSIVAVAPSLGVKRYIPTFGRVVLIFSFLLFIHQLKTSIIKHIILETDEEFQHQHDNFLTMDKILSVVLFVLGVLAIGEAFEFSLKAILICGLIGFALVVATFAHEENFDNILSWLKDTTNFGTMKGIVTKMECKINVYIGDKDKILNICQEIFMMMIADPNVFLDREPRCYPCEVDSNLAVLSIRCNIKKPGKGSNPQQRIVEKAIAIIKKHGVPMSYDA